jgi:HEXXH motif-containing protein
MVHHGLDARQLRALVSGGGDAGVLSALIGAEYSWRLATVRAVCDALRPRELAPLAPADEACALLTRVERRAPDVVREILSHPHVGTWATTVLRRLRDPSTATAEPLWVEAGYLHALAAAAAIRAGLDFRIRVPACDGWVVLPTLGRAALPVAARFGLAEAVRTGGRVRVRLGDSAVEVPADSSVDGPGWQAARSVSLSADGVTWSVVIDDLDPYRTPDDGPPPSDRLGAASLARWRSLLGAAWDLLAADHENEVRALARGLKVVTPLPAVGRFCSRSASSDDAFGSVLISAPDDPARLAAVLVHEFQHTKLGGLMHLADLCDASCEQLFYAPWRDDPRPLAGLLQGVYAFVGVSRFWRSHRRRAVGGHALLAHFEFALWREQTLRTIEMLRGQAALTELGAGVLGGLWRRIAPWQSDPVPSRVAVAARAASADHRAGWRLHHVRPDEDVVGELADGWLTGRRPELTDGWRSTLVPHPDPGLLDTRAVFARRRLADPDSFAAMLSRPEDAAEAVAGATPADVWLAAGMPYAARRMYLDALTGDRERLDAWAGLGLSLTDSRDQMARSALLLRPELVRAVAQRVTAASGAPPDVVALAAWTAGHTGLTVCQP